MAAGTPFWQRNRSPFLPRSLVRKSNRTPNTCFSQVHPLCGPLLPLAYREIPGATALGYWLVSPAWQVEARRTDTRPAAHTSVGGSDPPGGKRLHRPCWAGSALSATVPEHEDRRRHGRSPQSGRCARVLGYSASRSSADSLSYASAAARRSAASARAPSASPSYSSPYRPSLISG